MGEKDIFASLSSIVCSRRLKLFIRVHEVGVSSKEVHQRGVRSYAELLHRVMEKDEDSALAAITLLELLLVLLSHRQDAPHQGQAA